MMLDIVQNQLDDPLNNIRMDIYALLAALLNRPPTAELLEYLRSAECLPDLPAPMVKAWEALRRESAAHSVESLAEEYQSLFIGLGHGEVVPYASWYLEGLLMAVPLARLRLDLLKLGVVRGEGVHEAEDHGGLLCETMALLAGRPTLPKEVYALFFDQHVASWMFDFFSDLSKASSAVFYRAVAALGASLLEWEQRHLYVEPNRVH